MSFLKKLSRNWTTWEVMASETWDVEPGQTDAQIEELRNGIAARISAFVRSRLPSTEGGTDENKSQP